MLLTLGIIAILLVVMAPLYQEMTTAQLNAYSEKHKFNNQLIGQSLLSYAATATTLGTMPTPYTGSGYTSTIYNPADVTVPGVALTQELLKQNIAQSEMNDDGTATARVRVFQSVTGLILNTPLFYQSGPLVKLTYQYGAVYMTDCPKATASCNPTAAAGVPGESIAMTSANYNSWTTSGTDGPPALVSTLPLQKQMLGATADRLNKLRDSFLSYFRGQQITASAGDTTNWYPTGSSSLNGKTPATNQGCRDGWYPLSNGSILALIGSSISESSTTAWGGSIQYCRDYDPTGTKTPDASPHFSALRINASVSTGLDPDAVVVGNNIVLTF